LFKARITSLGDIGTTALLICERGPGDLMPEGLERSDIELPSEPLVLRQVHGGTVHYIDSVKVTEETRGAFGDGLIVTAPGIPVGIATADCIPLIIADISGKCAGVIHCGWKPITAGIIENAMSLALSDPEVRPSNLRFILGPGILGDEYEIGADVAVRFPKTAKPKGDGKFLLDLPEEIILRLGNFGIPREAITPSGLSSFACNWLPSYRRDGDSASRMMTLVWLG